MPAAAIAAAQAYDEAARELFGEHARPNFPDGVDAWIKRQAARVPAAWSAGLGPGDDGRRPHRKPVARDESNCGRLAD